METKTFRISSILWAEAQWLESDLEREGNGSHLCYKRINEAFASAPNRKTIAITFPIEETVELLDRANYYGGQRSNVWADDYRHIVSMYRRLLAQNI